MCSIMSYPAGACRRAVGSSEESALAVGASRRPERVDVDGAGPTGAMRGTVALGVCEVGSAVWEVVAHSGHNPLGEAITNGLEHRMQEVGDSTKHSELLVWLNDFRDRTPNSAPPQDSGCWSSPGVDSQLRVWVE